MIEDMIKDARRAAQDKSAVIDDMPGCILLVRYRELDSAYIINYTDPMHPWTTKLNVETSWEKASFNLYSAILPDFENCPPQQRHRQTVLSAKSIES